MTTGSNAHRGQSMGQHKLHLLTLLMPIPSAPASNWKHQEGKIRTWRQENTIAAGSTMDSSVHNIHPPRHPACKLLVAESTRSLSLPAAPCPSPPQDGGDQPWGSVSQQGFCQQQKPT